MTAAVEEEEEVKAVPVPEKETKKRDVYGKKSPYTNGMDMLYSWMLYVFGEDTHPQYGSDTQDLKKYKL